MGHMANLLAMAKMRGLPFCISEISSGVEAEAAFERAAAIVMLDPPGLESRNLA